MADKLYIMDSVGDETPVVLITDNWEISLTLWNFNRDGDWDLYGNDPEYVYIGPLEDDPECPNYSDFELNNMIKNAIWVD